MQRYTFFLFQLLRRKPICIRHLKLDTLSISSIVCALGIQTQMVENWEISTHYLDNTMINLFSKILYRCINYFFESFMWHVINLLIRFVYHSYREEITFKYLDNGEKYMFVFFGFSKLICSSLASSILICTCASFSFFANTQRTW